MKNLPVYKHPASYAREHDELAAYRASNQANTACKEAIETAIPVWWICFSARPAKPTHRSGRKPLSGIS